MRYRSRTVPTANGSKSIVISHGRLGGSSTITFSPYNRSTTESMNDVNNNPGSENYCDHWRRRENKASVDLSAAWHNDSTYTILWGRQCNRINFPSTALVDDDEYWGHMTPNFDWNQDGARMAAVRTDANWNARPKFKPSANLGNFVRELKDFPKLFKVATTKVPSLRRSFKRIKLNDPDKRKKFFIACAQMKIAKKEAKAFLRNISSDYLLTIFGWLPFMNDLFNMFDGMSNVKELYRRLDSEKKRRKEYTELKFVGTAKSSRTENWGSMYKMWLHSESMTGAYFDRRRVWEFRCKTVTKCRINLEKTNLLISEFNAYWSTLGLHCAFGTAWEAIPFSFVVDWFVPVGNLMAKMDSTGEYAPQMEVLSVTAMQEYKSFYEYRTKDKLFGIPTNPGIVFPSRKSEYGFYREAQPLQFYAPLGFKPGTGLNANRSLISVALLAQRW